MNEAGMIAEVYVDGATMFRQLGQTVTIHRLLFAIRRERNGIIK